jgi:hypothetical protein
MRGLILLLGTMLLWGPLYAHADTIDRRALVDRHNPQLTRIDPHAPLMIGNGELGFSADITGLQTFPEQYATTAPLLSMAQWAWHSFPNPNSYTESDGLVDVAVPGRGMQPYAWMRPGSDAGNKPALEWLRENPHRFSLGRIALSLHDEQGRPARFDALSDTEQHLDLWSGTLSSRFVYENQPVSVQTRVHPSRDMLMVEIRSPLIASGQLGVEVRYPGVSRTLNPDPSDWTHDTLHTTNVLQHAAGQLLLQRKLDDTIYYSGILAPGAHITNAGPHRFRILAAAGDRLVVLVSFDRNMRAAARAEDYPQAVSAVAAYWRDYWTRGGAVDFTGSTDPRAPELERRVVLSQYLAAINCAGSLPPQEEGLFSNSWNGKFHLEMYPWHAAHFATWGRPERLERSLQWYLDDLPKARQWAARHSVKGSWWPKMVGPEGRNSPSAINPFIMWQQPHPIYLAELIYRSRRDKATLDRYGEVVEATARLLASWPRWDPARNRYVLGPPIIPVQENHDPLTTLNPAFELEYFRWGLQTAQLWRQRRWLEREPQWDRVIAQLAPIAEQDGLYLPVESAPRFWIDAASETCKHHATAPQCLNRDHPSFLMAYGLIRSDRIDPEEMRRTLRATETNWDLRQTWGWDFPMVAMTAARLGEPESALAWLFMENKNNQWGISGMTARVSLTGARVADTYFPSNGSLLLAVGMLAAGWQGSMGPAPGFPKTGWTVRVEGIRPLPDPLSDPVL